MTEQASSFTTEQLNKVYAHEASELDESLHLAQLASLDADWPDEDWQSQKE